MLPNYENKMNEIQQDIVTMIEYSVESFHLSFEAVKNRDISMLKSAQNSRIKHLNYLANSVDNNIIVLLALHTPEAGQLRELIALLKSTNELVRIGDAAKVYAMGMEEAFVENLDLEKLMPYINQLHLSAINALETLKKMFEEFSIEYYEQILVEENKSDDLAVMLQKELVENICNDKSLVNSYITILKRVKKLEKAIDRIENVSKMLIYAKQGGKISTY
jgi:phosphate transport system protein